MLDDEDETLREIRLIELRLDQRESAVLAAMQTITRQMVQMETTLAGRLDRLERLLSK